MPIPRELLRLEPAARQLLLEEERVMHCATVSDAGIPHVVPLWFVWDGESLWVNSLRSSRRHKDLRAGSPVSLCIDAGIEYGDLRGLTWNGKFKPADPPTSVRKSFSSKYWRGVDVPEMKSHEWLQFQVDSEASWDFRRIAQVGRDRRLDAISSQDS